LEELKMATNNIGRRWLRGVIREPEKWSRAYDDGGRRYEFQTSNMAESFNGVLKGIRAIPVNVIVSFIFYRLVAWFNDRFSQAMALRSRTSYGPLNLCVTLLRQRIGLAHMSERVDGPRGGVNWAFFKF
jgi:hypothetical protein